jgi:hypothetical protein
VPIPVEEQPWYPAWRKAVERLIAAKEALNDTKPDMPERKAAEAEVRAAQSAYRLIASKI